MTITITLPHPPSSLRPNGRSHWRVKAQSVKDYRTLAKVRAMEALGTARPMWAAAKVAITWESNTMRHPDPDNIVASLKAAFDGLQDAGVVANDRGLWPERPVILTKRPWPEVRLVITPE